MSQPTQLVGDSTRINTVFCRAQSRPHSHPHAEAAGFERQPVFRSWSTPPPTGASLQSCPCGTPPCHSTSSFSLELPQAPAGCTSAAGPPRTASAERATFSQFAGLRGAPRLPVYSTCCPPSAALGLPGWEMRRRSPGPGATWASASPRGVLGRVSPGAAQAEPCNWRRNLQHSPSAGFPGSQDPEAGLPVTPAHPSAPPFLPPRRLLPAQGPGPADAPRSTDGAQSGRELRAMGGSHSQTPRGREPDGERPPRPRETA